MKEKLQAAREALQEARLHVWTPKRVYAVIESLIDMVEELAADPKKKS